MFLVYFCSADHDNSNSNILYVQLYLKVPLKVTCLDYFSPCPNDSNIHTSFWLHFLYALSFLFSVDSLLMWVCCTYLLWLWDMLWSFTRFVNPYAFFTCIVFQKWLSTVANSINAATTSLPSSLSRFPHNPNPSWQIAYENVCARHSGRGLSELAA